MLFFVVISQIFFMTASVNGKLELKIIKIDPTVDFDTTLKIGYFNAPEIPDGYTVIAVNGYTNFPHVDLIFCNYDNNSNYVGVITISSRAVTEQATIEFICRKN
nr:MAG TPA: hypothetical protein [Caudoviricetes sp.]